MSETPDVPAELEELARQVGDQVETFLLALRSIAGGEAGDGAVSLLLLQVSQVLLAGARLGVQADFVLQDRYETDPGPDPDLDELRLRLARLLADVDDYAAPVDPYDPDRPTEVRHLSDELAAAAAELAHGLVHLRQGRPSEALWWWQYSYVSSWGPALSGALAALQSVVTHDRLDVDTETTRRERGHLEEIGLRWTDEV